MNKWVKIRPSIIIAVVLLVIFSGCKTTRKIIKEPLKDAGSEYLFDQLKANELKFESFNAKFNLDYIFDKKKTEFKGQIRIIKDSMIWISFSPALGIEAARLLITNDSVKFINRINKTFFEGDYIYLNEYLDTNVDYDILQALIIGNDLSHYEDGKFRASVDNKFYKLSTASRAKLKKYVRKNELEPKVFIQNIWLSPDNFKILQLSLKEIRKENKKLDATYSRFIDISGQLFPRVIDFDLQADNNIGVHLDYSKISINEELNFPFSVPSKYQLITKLD